MLTEKKAFVVQHDEQLSFTEQNQHVQEVGVFQTKKVQTESWFVFWAVMVILNCIDSVNGYGMLCVVVMHMDAQFHVLKEKRSMMRVLNAQLRHVLLLLANHMLTVFSGNEKHTAFNCSGAFKL